MDCATAPVWVNVSLVLHAMLHAATQVGAGGSLLASSNMQLVLLFKQPSYTGCTATNEVQMHRQTQTFAAI